MNERNSVEQKRATKESATNSLPESEEKKEAPIVMSLKSGVPRRRLSVKNAFDDLEKDSRAVLQLLNGSELRSKLIGKKSKMDDKETVLEMRTASFWGRWGLSLILV